MTMSERRPDRTLGGNHNRFWEYCEEEKLCLQECQACGQLAWPVVEACLHCRGKVLEWRQLSGRGWLASWCTFDKRYYEELPVPWDTILVELAEGPLFISNPSGFANTDAKLGVPLQVTFLDCADRAGSFKLPVFERGREAHR
jgi:hypothetical protein